MSVPILKIQNLHKNYRKIVAVEDLNLELHANECVAFIGPNGAGKSTTMKAIAGLIPYDGQIEICGFDVIKNPLDAKKKLGYVSQELSLYEHLTAEEHMHFIAKVRDMRLEDCKKAVDFFFKLTELENAAHKLVRDFSGGMARKLAMACALLSAPDFVILDESFVGLDPEGTHRFGKFLKQYAASGKCVLISSHILEMLHALCNRFVFIHRGKIVGDYGKDALESALANPQTPTITDLYLKLTEKNLS